MKTVLLSSGGKDSLAVAMLLSRDGVELHSFTVDWGIPENVLGLPAAEKIAAKYCRSHHVLRVATGPYLAATTNFPADWNYTTVPFKLLTVFSLGAMYAVTIGAKAVATGARCDVFRQDFPDTLRAALEMSSKVRDPLGVLTPLNTHPGRQGELNGEVFKIIRDEPLWRETSYCNDHPPCGACYGCRVRADWLREAAA